MRTPTRTARQLLRCDKCLQLTHIDLLDSKPDAFGDFTRLECFDCYGSGYARQVLASSLQMKATLSARKAETTSHARLP